VGVISERAVGNAFDSCRRDSLLVWRVADYISWSDVAFKRNSGVYPGLRVSLAVKINMSGRSSASVADWLGRSSASLADWLGR